MIRARRLAAVFALSAPLLLASGCKQGVGERCQANSDCDDGLTCVLPAGVSFQAGGTCKASDQSGATDDLSASVNDMATSGHD
jgi:hypothetical protein